MEVAIIHRPRYDDWSLPKGKLAPGESHIEGAVREVLEETGFRVQPGRSLGEVRYLKKSGGGAREKVVHYWAMRAISGGFSPNREVDRLDWLTVDQARERVTRGIDREMLERFALRPAMTGSVLLVRHASAGSRGDWNGDDKERPLDETGQDQADELVRLLSRFEVDDIVTAEHLRCVETVQPLSESIGVAARTDPLLSEEGFPGHEEEALELRQEPGPARRRRGRVQSARRDRRDRRPARGVRRDRRGRVARAEEGRGLGAGLRRPPAGGGGAPTAAEDRVAAQSQSGEYGSR